MKIRIMHFGDVHLGMETYGKIDPETGLNSRIADFSRSLNAAIDKALEKGVNIALFAGDAYKSRDPNQTHQREFASCIRRLTEAGLPVVMLTGNHDLPNSRARANAIEIYQTLGIKNVYILNKPDVLTVETAAGPIQIAAIPYLLRSTVLSREEMRNLSIQETTELLVKKYTDYIGYLSRRLDPSIPSVLLGHFWIKDAKVSSQSSYLNVAEPEVLLSNVKNPAFDYVAMGHIHKYQDLNRGGNPPVVYCGSIERIDFGEKDEDKGFVYVELEKGSASYEFISVPARRFVEIEVDADVEDPTSCIIAKIESKQIEDAIVKLIYHIPAEKLPLVRESEIRRALSPAFLVVAIIKNIIHKRETVRNRLLNESLDPLRALDMYFETVENFRKRKSELMDYARPLVEELIAEENKM